MYAVNDLIERLRDRKRAWSHAMNYTDRLEAANRIVALEAWVAELEVEKYAAFTDGLGAGAEICSFLAETTYVDDTDAFEAATGCEAAIMKVVKQHRKKQAEARAALKGTSHE